MRRNKHNYLEELSGEELRKAQRFVPVPFLFNLIDSDESLVCEEILRIIPGKRLVAFGTWGEKEVVAKLFYGSRKANQHIERDKKGINALIQAGISTPILYYQGASVDKQIQVLIFEKIQNAISPQAPFDVGCSKEDKKQCQIYRALTLELATQHVLGIYQRDMHFKNFLVTSDRIYTLDGGDIEKYDYPLLKEKSLDNLALFVAQFGVEAEKFQDELFQIYTESRGWKINHTDYKFLIKNIQKWKKIRQHKFQRKLFRDCSAFKKIKSRSALIMCNRNYDTDAFRALLTRPDAIFLQPESQLLKNGRTTTVIKTTINERELVIKRYNIKHFWHRLRRCLRPTRAAKSWRLSQYLTLIGIPTARPIALVEKRFLGLRSQSYFIMEPISGMHIGEYFSQTSLTHEEKIKMVKKVIALFNNLAQFRLIHGDLKVTNILICNDKPILIDLDGMKEHKCPFGFERAFRRELSRFLKNWENQPDIYQLFKCEFRIRM